MSVRPGGDVRPPSAARPGDELRPVGGGAPVAGRSPGRLVVYRLRRDRVTLTAGIVAATIVAVAAFAPVVCWLLGIDPYEANTHLLDRDTGLPAGPWGGAGWDHPLGVEPASGRDVLARLIYGARTSLFVAGAATLITVVVGVVLGLVAGYVGGVVDTVISRLMDLTLAFPVLLFAISLLVTLQSVDSLFGLDGAALRVALLIGVIGIFNWAYLGRVVRGQTLTLRTRQFVEAARAAGAGRTRILLVELLPNLAGTILVYTTLTLPVNILNEAALSFLGLGVLPPTASWGEMVSSATSYFEVVPTSMVYPGAAIFVTVLAFNVLGDGLRDAVDPRGGHA